MQQKDDESPLTQLTGAHVHLALGGDKVPEAQFTFQELISRHGSSVMLLNGLAATHMAQCHYAEAERVLLDALEKVRCLPCSTSRTRPT